MEILREKNGQKEVVTLVGKIDTNAAAEMEKILLDCIGEGIALEVEMAQASYICSAALRVFLKTQKEINKLPGSSMEILHCNQGVKDIFEITGFSGILTIKEDEK